jgi:hypothetical protein
MSVTWPPPTAVDAATTVTVTGIVIDTPVPVIVMAPTNCPVAVKDAVFQLADNVAGWDLLTLNVAAESAIQDWFALTVSATAAVDTVLN